jgi:ketosteroid isomerase-like protein
MWRRRFRLRAVTSYGIGEVNRLIAETIINMERAAMDRWAKGDPDGFLEISDPEVVYFDPFLEKRLDGIGALRALYDSFRGQFRIDHYDIIDPKVRVSGDMAVLTFNFVGRSNGAEQRWNTTEVYERKDGRWRIVHTHWAFTKPQQ